MCTGTVARAVAAALFLLAGAARANGILTIRDFSATLDGMTGLRLNPDDWLGVPPALAALSEQKDLPSEAPAQVDDDSILWRLNPLRNGELFSPLQIVIVFPVYAGRKWEAPVSVPGAPSLLDSQGAGVSLFDGFPIAPLASDGEPWLHFDEITVAPRDYAFALDYEGSVRAFSAPAESPEPASAVLFSLGLALLAMRGRLRVACRKAARAMLE
jgi:hypothetical protein